MNIDAHVSFVEDYPGLGQARNWNPDEFGARMASEGVSGCVSVATQPNLAETDFLLGLAMEYPFVRSVSGWIALGSPNFMSQLDHYAAYPALGAVRIDATEVSEDVFRKDSVRVGCSFLGRFGKRLDLRVQPALLVPTADFLAKIGDGPVAVTVCTVSGDKSADDEKLYALCRMQKMSNVTMKLVAPWEIKDSETDLWVKSILDMFGAERCMMGSGYMVGRETVSYEERRAGFDWFLDGCSESERVEVLGGTAARFYGLEAS